MNASNNNASTIKKIAELSLVDLHYGILYHLFSLHFFQKAENVKKPELFFKKISNVKMGCSKEVDGNFLKDIILEAKVN